MQANLDKAHWLNSHYANYGIKWYLQDLVRLNAIFNREYNKWKNEQWKSQVEEVELQEKLEYEKRMKMADDLYLEHYGLTFSDDMKIDRHDAHFKYMELMTQLAS